MSMYNLKEDKIHTKSQCLKCKYFNKQNGKCSGIGKHCFGYSTLAKTIIDPTTKLALSTSAIETIKSKLESEEE